MARRGSTKKLTVAEITHPRYDLRLREWMKWRRTYHGGFHFINTYLKSLSSREDPTDFAVRKDIAYSPSFAGTAIDEVRNSIYQRMSGVSRLNGSLSYSKACAGEDNGVDLKGSTMNRFMGIKVLTELLVMGRVGVYVDMPKIDPDGTLLDTTSKRPYLYAYETEDIRSWSYDDTDNPNEFGSLLLRDYTYEYDQETGLPKGETSRFRHYWLKDGQVYVQFYNHEGQKINGFAEGPDQNDSQPIKLGIDRIPFVIFELSDSLMKDIANIQIALLNLESSNLMVAINAMFPFYTEQFDPRAFSVYMKQIAGPDAGGTQQDANTSKTEAIQIGGAGTGRRYPVNTERPGFIAPPTDPLKTSMELVERLYEKIRLLLLLGISNLQPRVTSAQAKGFDERKTESGLSYIALELEQGERQIADYWSKYEKTQSASIKYPENYDIKSDKEKIEDATGLSKIIPSIPSQTAQRYLSKELSRMLLATRIPAEDFKKIDDELKNSKGISSNADEISIDVQNGLVDLETASQLRGYPKGSVERASQDHADRLKRIQEAQTPIGGDPGARGVSDLSDTPAKPGANEKQKLKDQGNLPDRGPGKKANQKQDSPRVKNQ